MFRKLSIAGFDQLINRPEQLIARNAPEHGDPECGISTSDYGYRLAAVCVLERARVLSMEEERSGNCRLESRRDVRRNSGSWFLLRRNEWPDAVDEQFL